ncbi:MAG: LacI family DNA-binding transcriptional regulator [Candidatus Aureabacteria bacterium]|nr:LacI family DNA-binding transcriptional regulator [Candidatus Auribacterota bacterium]
MKNETSTNDFCARIAVSLIEYWKIHRRFDANIKDLAKHAGVSRDTAYRWLNKKALPKHEKAQLIKSWLNQKQKP